MSVCMCLSHFNLIGHTKYGIISLQRSGRHLVILESLETVVDVQFLILDVDKLLEVDLVWIQRFNLMENRFHTCLSIFGNLFCDEQAAHLSNRIVIQKLK